MNYKFLKNVYVAPKTHYRRVQKICVMNNSNFDNEKKIFDLRAEYPYDETIAEKCYESEENI